ncbi:sugar ABC transporter permease [Micromonospora globispora]|uniref:Sugar ABC transporter permease n=1 Tax=Micromonospora globispora TaxID=1450148 RepID=A0A317K5I1_9ACTN|nr:carbohydrate ABC transporter permease [Micromonospora globispora]PWU47584.1 sugar ABC transporter permease [Micromonospora globispora]PWU56994.1 sugar ABC transporter permease [Micromonospora globispora]RQW95485.1 sugar ABC transporter permease [Micromonospora globispora]
MTAQATRSKTRPAGTWTSTGDRRPPATGKVLTYAVLIALSIVVLAPVVWTVLSSFKTQAELAQRPPTILPDSFGLTNYTEAMQTFRFATYLKNSVVVTVGATVLTLMINTTAAYGLAKYNFRGRNFLFLVTLGTIMIPLQIILIPVYQVASDLHLVNSLWGLIIPPAATPTGVFLLRQYMLGIPDDLIEAARIDGAGEFRIFLRIIVPLCGAPIAVLTIFSVIWRWNDFLWPLIISQSQDKYTLPVALAQFDSQLVVPFNYILAMSVVSMLPVIIIFLVLQRHIVRGIASTGLK